MGQFIDYVIRPIRKRGTGVIIAAILIIISFIPAVPLWIAESLRILAGLVVGIVVHHLWQSKVIEIERRKERKDVIEQFTHLQLFGLERVLPERDSDEKGKKTFDFLERFRQFDPRSELVIIGITVGYIPQHLPNQIRDLLQKHSKMKMIICVLDPDSPCVSRRAQEVFENSQETKKKIHDAINGWRKFKEEFPEQIVLKKSMAIPYGEYEAVDIDKDRGRIYYTPVVYRAHTNVTPSFIFSPHTLLYDFHKTVINTILNDAEDA